MTEPTRPAGEDVGLPRGPLGQAPLAEDETVADGEFTPTGQGTAKKALDILAGHGFQVPSATARKNLAMAFAKRDKVVYGKAFDALKVEGPAVDLEDASAVDEHLGRIRLYEVKSTRRADVGEDFEKYFFSLSTAELLVAQSLGDQFAFVFVNVEREEVLELTLQELFSKARAIYPTWSIRF